MNTDVFDALANPIRRELLGLLAGGPQPVKSLAAHFERGRPAISEHLRVLRAAGLVREEQRGRENFYHLDATPLGQVSVWLADVQRFWESKVDNREALIDQKAP